MIVLFVRTYSTNSMDEMKLERIRFDKGQTILNSLLGGETGMNEAD